MSGPASFSPGLGAVVLAAVLVVVALLGLLGVLSYLEVGKTARRRRRFRRALVEAHRVARAQTPPAPGALTAAEATRLASIRARARFMVDEPTHPLGWVAKIRFLWREGHGGWVIASLAGAFSMATHFGAFWLITGGGWAGAVAVTVLSTLLMVAACLWVVWGLAHPS